MATLGIRLIFVYSKSVLRDCDEYKGGHHPNTRLDKVATKTIIRKF